MAKKLTLFERFQATKAQQAVQVRRKHRVARKVREALVAPHPDSAIAAYVAAADRLAGGIAARIEGALARGIPVALLEPTLLALADGMAKHADRAATRIDRHAIKWSEKLLQVRLPDQSVQQAAMRELFVSQNVGLYRRMVNDQLTAVAGLDADDARHKLWVSRVRAPLIARTEAGRLSGMAQQYWAVEAGSETYVWVTMRDGKVRDGHQHLDGSVHRWDAPPATGRQEGLNHPGGAINCRCRALPVEAIQLAQE